MRALLPLAIMSLVGEFAYAITNTSFLPLYLRSDLKMGAETIGLVIVVFVATEALLKSYFGHLGDRVGRKPLMVIGPLCSAVSALIIIRVTHLGAIFALRVLDGFGAAALWPAMFAMAAFKVKEEDRTTAMSMLNFTYIAGVALGFAAGRMIFELAGTGSFYLSSILFALTSAVALLMVRDEPRHAAKPAATPKAEEGVGWREVLHGFTAAPMMTLIIGIAFIGVGMLMPIATLYTRDVLKLSPDRLPILFLPVAALVAVVSVPIGRIVDRWSKARAIKLGLALCAISMFGFGLSTNMAVMVVSIMGLGLGFVMASPAWMALITTLTTPERRGAIIGAMGTAQGVGALAGPYLGGLLYDRVSHEAPFLVAGALLTLSLILAIFGVHDRK